MNEQRIYDLAGALIAASSSLEVERAIFLAVRIIALLDNVEQEQDETEI
jgi:hypothetical protein